MCSGHVCVCVFLWVSCTNVVETNKHLSPKLVLASGCVGCGNFEAGPAICILSLILAGSAVKIRASFGVKRNNRKCLSKLRGPFVCRWSTWGVEMGKKVMGSVDYGFEDVTVGHGSCHLMHYISYLFRYFRGISALTLVAMVQQRTNGPIFI